jgi:hypothetical protein
MVLNGPSRFVAWFSLALLILTGLTPAQGVVVCIEADGCLSIEFKATDRDCGTCEGHEPGELAGETLSGPATTSGCPCVDYVVPGTADERVVANHPPDLHAGPLVAPAAERFVVQATPAVGGERGPPPRGPRVAQKLAHLRSVILLV